MPKPKSNVPVVQVKGPAPKPKRKQKKNKEGLTPYLTLMADLVRAPLEGAVRPDMSAHSSQLWRETEYRTISTDANGDFGILFTGLVNNYTSGNYTLAAGVVTAVGAPLPMGNYTEFSTSVSEYRPYGFVVEVEYIGREDERRGYYGTLLTSNTPGLTSTLDSLNDEAEYVEVKAGGSTARVVRFPDSSTFVAPSVTSGITDPNQYVFVLGRGLPASTACVRIKYSIVVEIVVQHGLMLSKSASYTPCHMGQCHAAANIIGPAAQVATMEVGNAYDKVVANATRLAKFGAELHGVWNIAKTWAVPFMEAVAL